MDFFKTGFTEFDKSFGGIPSTGLTLVSCESSDYSFDLIINLINRITIEDICCSLLSFSKMEEDAKLSFICNTSQIPKVEFNEENSNPDVYTFLQQGKEDYDKRGIDFIASSDLSLNNLCNVIEDACHKGTKVFFIHSLNNIYEEDENDLVYYNSFSTKIQTLNNLAKRHNISIVAMYDAQPVNYEELDDACVSEINYKLFQQYDNYSCFIIIQEIKPEFYNSNKFESKIFYASPLKSSDILSTVNSDLWYWYKEISTVSEDNMLDFPEEDRALCKTQM